MKLNDAKKLLLESDYRIIGVDAEKGIRPVGSPESEEGELDSDVLHDVAQGLGDEGFDAREIADIMANSTDKINELIEKGVDAEDIVKIVAYDNCPESDVEDDDDVEDVEDDIDEEEDEDEALGESKIRVRAIRKARGGKCRESCNGKKKGRCVRDAKELEESLSDDEYPETFRGLRGREDADDLEDFKTSPRVKAELLKAALTPNFVAGIIKDTDFEVNDREIKDYAFTVVEEVLDTKDPVDNLQRRVKRHFVN